jgi:hypothetical protein
MFCAHKTPSVRYLVAATWVGLAAATAAAQGGMGPRTLENVVRPDEPAGGPEGLGGTRHAAGVVFPAVVKLPVPKSPDPFLHDQMARMWSDFDTAITAVRDEISRFVEEKQASAAQAGELDAAVFWRQMRQGLAFPGPVDLPAQESDLVEWRQRHPAIDLPLDAVHLVDLWRSRLGEAETVLVKDYETVVRQATEQGHLDAATALRRDLDSLRRVFSDAGADAEAASSPKKKRALVEGEVCRPDGGVKDSSIDDAWGDYEGSINLAVDRLREALSRTIKTAAKKGELDDAEEASRALEALDRQGLLPSLRESQAEVKRAKSLIGAAGDRLGAAYKRVSKKLAEAERLDEALGVLKELENLEQHTPVIAVWVVFVGGRRIGERAFYSNGHLDAPRGGKVWQQDGKAVVMRNTDPATEGGLWQDSCVLSPDGTRMAGRNHRGERVELRRLR